MTDAAIRPPSWVAWLQATRPRTLTAAVGAVAVGSGLAVGAGRHRWGATLSALGVAVALQIASNLYNDYGDFVRGADAHRIGPARAAQSGWLAASHVRGGAFVAIGLAVAAGLHLVQLLGWTALAIGITSIVSAIAYTAGPAPLAYVGLGDAFVMAFFGVVAVNGTFLAQAGSLTSTSLALSLAVGAMATAILVVNNLRDRAGDAAANKRTLVVRFGRSFGLGEYAGLLLLAYAVPLALAVIERRELWLLPLLSLPIAFGCTRRVFALDGPDLNGQLARTALLGLVFNVLLAVSAACLGGAR